MPSVLIIGINYAPERTGIAVHTTGLAEGLAARGWDVTVLTGVPHYPFWRPLPIPDASNGPVRVIRRRHFIPSKQSLAARAAFEASWVASCLPTVLKRQRADVILGITPNLGGGLLAAIGAERMRVPYVLMFQDLLGQAARQSRVKHGISAASRLESLEVFLAHRAASVAVIADGFGSYLADRGVPAERICRVHNPVRIQPPQRPRDETRRDLGWKTDEFVVLYSGNMGLKQGLDNVLAAAQLADSTERIRFVLQGDGSERARLERQAKDLRIPNVTFLPLSSLEELPDVLAAADLLLLNQHREVRDMSLPSKLAGYFSVGLPVVAAVADDSEAGREIATSGGGVVVEPDRPEALLQTARDLVRNSGRRRTLGAAGRAFAAAALQPETTLCQMESLLEMSLRFRCRKEGRATE